MRRCLLALLLAMTAVPARAEAPLIPRSVLFGNPTRTSAVISPDGSTLAYLAPRDGVLNVWVAPVGRLNDAKPVTREKTRPIRGFFFSPDSRRILYAQDKGGTEDFLLYGVHLADGAIVNYTPFTKTRVELVATSPLNKTTILIGLNNRDPHWHDLYSLNLDTGALNLLRKSDGVAGYVTDFALKPVFAQIANDDGSYTVDRIEPDGSLKKFLDIPFADGLTTSTAGIPKDADFAYILDSRGRDTTALEKIDLKTGAETMIAEDKRADIGGGLADPETGTIHAYAVDYLKPRWVALDDRYRDDIAFLDKQGGTWGVTSQTDDDSKWTVVIDKVTEPATFYLYDRRAKSLAKLFTTRPELEKYTLAPMQALEITARDGKTLTAYLTLPAGVGTRPDKPLPLVLDVHGGPWARDSYGYDSEHQWLANRGYAVLAVNYRGSTGFGKAFITAADKQWGAAMEDDLLDAAAWAVHEKITTPEQEAILGGSYGGYAVLAALTMHPTSFACGVDIVGPSNLFTLLQTIPPYWKSGYEQMVQRMGDPRTETGRDLLKDRSPLTYADRIARPLLIGQGANDPRVNQRESDQLVRAMKAKSIPVTYVLFPDEGHGFARPENRVAFNAVTEGFLSTCLHGRAEPIGDAFHGSTITVPEGAENVPGLKAALPAQK